MPKARFARKSLMSVALLLGGSTVFSDGCLNTIASINVCGTILTFCTPADQVNLMFPYLEKPDFQADPSCTIPLGCGGSDIYTNIPEGFPGGEASEQPTNTTGGGIGSGGSSGGSGGGGV